VRTRWRSEIRQERRNSVVAQLSVTVFDVNHGNSIHLRTPNDKDVLVDAGRSADFSPGAFLKGKGRNLDALYVSHGHADHIEDVADVQGLVPKMLVWPRVSMKKLYEESRPQERHLVETYYQFQAKYTSPLSPQDDPRDPAWGGGATFAPFGNVIDESRPLNDLSLVVLATWASVKLLIPGDLEEAGWKTLLLKPEFSKAVRGTELMVASHHGLESGFCSELFDLFHPNLMIVSAGRFRDTSATGKYDAVTTGMWVRAPGDPVKRKCKVVSTRNNGCIAVGISGDSQVDVVVSRW